VFYKQFKNKTKQSRGVEVWTGVDPGYLEHEDYSVGGLFKNNNTNYKVKISYESDNVFGTIINIMVNN
jgi:hypothetical protein